METRPEDFGRYKNRSGEPRMTPSISYRSPLHRVLAFDQFGAVVMRLEPGAGADAAWEAAGAAGVSRYDGAEWVDENAEREAGRGTARAAENAADEVNR